jgi:hypothetical protein
MQHDSCEDAGMDRLLTIAENAFSVLIRAPIEERKGDERVVSSL